VPRPEPLKAFAALLLAGLVLAATVPGAAQTKSSAQQKLDDVQKALEQSRAQHDALAKQADDLAAELQALRDGEVKAAAAAQAHEAALTDLEGKLGNLGAAEAAKSRELDRQHAGEAKLLMALTRLARDPPEALALAPQDPVSSLRGGILMGRAIPPIERRARDLGAEIAQLEQLRVEIAQTERQHKSEREGLAREQSQIASLIGRKQDLLNRAQAGAAASDKRQAELAAKASDLRDLIARLEAERRNRDASARSSRTPPPRAGSPVPVTAAAAVLPDPTRPRNIRPFNQAKGHMAVPSSGLITVRFGEPDPANTAASGAKGLTFETRPGAQVVAPFDGRVLFAGIFKGYGQILIIGHGDGYHSLLAGLDRVDASVGQWLVAGEPVGAMSSGSQKPHLYLELRRNGQPIDPLPWLAIRDEKVNG
jgi:septal ring factor EnvC (AmiA/AmiB activator)